MKDFVLATLKRFVDHPRDLHVAEVAGDKTIIMEVRCHPDDVGKVIGKSGKVIQAVRSLANVLASKENKRAVVEVVE